jgi:methionine-gamma-lyase
MRPKGNSMKKKTTKHPYAMETQLIHGRAYTKKWDYNHHVVPPISSSSTFRLDSTQRGAKGFVEFAHADEDLSVFSRAPVYIYDRLGEPNKDILEENLATAENGEAAVTFSSGMAAIAAVFGILTGSGDEIIAHRMLYGSTYSLIKNWFPRYRIGIHWVDFLEPNCLKRKFTPRTKVVYFESPVNPSMEVIDIEKIVEVVRTENRKRSSRNRIAVVIDNTFATPFCQRPLDLGVDFVVHSLTKGICGFGTDVGGAVVTDRKHYDHLLQYRKDFGGVLAPKSAWPILVYGLPSLPIRMKRQQATALEVAKFLRTDRRVAGVHYPGLDTFPYYSLAKKQMHDYEGNFAPGSLLYFTLKGKDPQIRKAKAERMINHLAKEAYAITLAVSLGNVRTLVEHPSSMTHSTIPVEKQLQRGVDPGGIRLSIGLEDADDIITDLSAALSRFE